MTSIDLAALEDVPAGSAKRFDVAGHRLAVVRIDEDVYVLGDRCTHQDVSLAEGDVDTEERTLECWKHGSQFDLVNGEPLSLPATKPTPVYEAKVVDGRIVVEVPE